MSEIRHLLDTINKIKRNGDLTKQSLNDLCDAVTKYEQREAFVDYNEKLNSKNYTGSTDI